MDERLFRDAMGKFATGITVISMYDKDEPVGMTVNAFMSISLDPMLIAISIDESATMYDLFTVGALFGVSMLEESQKDLSQYFARQIDDVDGLSFRDQSGVPVIDDSLANLTCKIINAVEAGDHTIYIAEVNDITVYDGEPLIYYSSSYRYLKDQ